MRPFLVGLSIGGLLAAPAGVWSALSMFVTFDGKLPMESVVRAMLDLPRPPPAACALGAPVGPGEACVPHVTRDLPAGHSLVDGDVVGRLLPLDYVPGGILVDPVGRRLRGPVFVDEYLLEPMVMP